MDTIEVKLMLGIKDTIEMDNVKKFFNNIKSPYGFTYCDVKEIVTGGNFLIKISYPRFFKGVNAYLVTKESECLDVQEHFCNRVRNKFGDDIELELTRVDIPFTYKMKGCSLKPYEHIFKIFALIYSKKYPKSSTKGIIELKTGEKETLTFADTKCPSAYNHKLMIYNQYENILRKTSSDKEFEEILINYPDLPYRMRCEVSKCIDRKSFSLEKFQNFNILKGYYYQYKEYILKNFLDFTEIDKLYEETAEKLAEKFQKEREKYGLSFLYKMFILENKTDIYDYKILKMVLKKAIENPKTREGAITRTKKIIEACELAWEIILKDTYDCLLKMKEDFEKMEIEKEED